MYRFRYNCGPLDKVGCKWQYLVDLVDWRHCQCLIYSTARAWTMRFTWQEIRLKLSLFCCVRKSWAGPRLSSNYFSSVLTKTVSAEKVERLGLFMLEKVSVRDREWEYGCVFKCSCVRYRESVFAWMCKCVCVCVHLWGSMRLLLCVNKVSKINKCCFDHRDKFFHYFSTQQASINCSSMTQRLDQLFTSNCPRFKSVLS